MAAVREQLGLSATRSERWSRWAAATSRDRRGAAAGRRARWRRRTGPARRSRSTAVLVLDVAQALLAERCGRWQWSAPHNHAGLEIADDLGLGRGPGGEAARQSRRRTWRHWLGRSSRRACWTSPRSCRSSYGSRWEAAAVRESLEAQHSLVCEKREADTEITLKYNPGPCGNHIHCVHRSRVCIPRQLDC